jgi:DNA-binding HxlR family transcriptional regulator
MTNRSYGHYCPVAQTLDVVGDRWALLVVRELLSGPQRFTDLQTRLPGIGTNQLATRLRDLEAENLAARRTLPPPAASTVYELTEEGRLLEPALLALARFGTPRLRALSPVNTFRPAWAALALRARAGTGRLPRHAHHWEVRVESEVFGIEAGPAGCATTAGPASGPATVITTDTITAFALARGELSAQQACERGLLETDASPGELAAWAVLFGLPDDLLGGAPTDAVDPLDPGA